MELVIGLFIVVTSIIIGIADQDGFQIRTRPYMSKAMLKAHKEKKYKTFREVVRPSCKSEEEFQESWRLHYTYLLKDIEKIYGLKNLDIDKI